MDIRRLQVAARWIWRSLNAAGTLQWFWSVGGGLVMTGIAASVLHLASPWRWVVALGIFILIGALLATILGRFRIQRVERCKQLARRFGSWASDETSYIRARASEWRLQHQQAGVQHHDDDWRVVGDRAFEEATLMQWKERFRAGLLDLLREAEDLGVKDRQTLDIAIAPRHVSDLDQLNYRLAHFVIPALEPSPAYDSSAPPQRPEVKGSALRQR